MKKFITQFRKYDTKKDDYYNLFSNRNVKQFELNVKGMPTRIMKHQNHLFFVDAKTKKKIPVDFHGLLAKDENVANKQYYLMQILQVEKDIVKAEFIYKNWDWIEFIIYSQSLIATRILEN